MALALTYLSAVIFIEELLVLLFEAHALYRFADVEPIGVDLWDTYMAPELARRPVSSHHPPRR